MLFKENALPKSMIIIGGGPIGIELAQMLTKLNVECTIIEMMDTILSGVVEPEFVQALTQKLTASGINVFTSTKVLEINKSGRKYNTIITDKKGLKNVISSEQVMVAAGRIPNVEDLDLGARDIRFNQLLELLRYRLFQKRFKCLFQSGTECTGGAIRMHLGRPFRRPLLFRFVGHENIPRICHYSFPVLGTSGPSITGDFATANGFCDIN